MQAGLPNFENYLRMLRSHVKEYRDRYERRCVPCIITGLHECKPTKNGGELCQNCRGKGRRMCDFSQPTDEPMPGTDINIAKLSIDGVDNDDADYEHESGSSLLSYTGPNANETLDEKQILSYLSRQAKKHAIKGVENYALEVEQYLPSLITNAMDHAFQLQIQDPTILTRLYWTAPAFVLVGEHPCHQCHKINQQCDEKVPCGRCCANQGDYPVRCSYDGITMADIWSIDNKKGNPGFDNQTKYWPEPGRCFPCTQENTECDDKKNAKDA